jgi:hypothetical protein
MFNIAGGNLHSDGQIASNTPQGVQPLQSSPSTLSSLSLPSLPSSPSSPVPLGVKITSHTSGQQVPTGQLTISGTSTDTPNANCEVYTDVNDLKPMQKVAARGPGGNSDYSAWTFTYTPAYSLIKNGTNNLTSKISCIDSPTTGNLTKWNSVNLTGVDGLVLQQQPPSIISAVSNSTNNTGLLISQSAALSPFEPTVAAGATSFDNDNDNSDNDDDDDNDNDDNSDDNDSDNDSSDNDNDNDNTDNSFLDNFDDSEQTNEEESNDDDEQDNEEVDEETDTSDDEDDSEEEDNDAGFVSSDNTADETNDETVTIANEANDVDDDENINNDGNPSNSAGNNNENNIGQNNNAWNEDNSVAENNEENGNNVNENLDLFTNEKSADVSFESETNEETDDEDECNIGDRGFPFCDGRID